MLISLPAWPNALSTRAEHSVVVNCEELKINQLKGIKFKLQSFGKSDINAPCKIIMVI
jgi:hypothetical protein